MVQILLLVDEYVRSLSYLIISPSRILSMSTRKLLIYGLATVLLISASKGTVIVGSIFYKAMKWTMTWFPGYAFIYAYAGYVSFWIVLIALLVEMGIYYAFAMALHYTMKLLGGKSALPHTLGVVAYAWTADVLAIIIGLMGTWLDISLTIVILIVSLLLSLILKLILIARAVTIVHEVKLSTSILAIILVTVLFTIVGLAIMVA